VVATATAGSGTVPISWTGSMVSPGVEPQGYYVTRVPGGGSSATCGTPSVLITTTSCSDTSVPDGTYHYVVTAVYRSWTAASASSNDAHVVNDNIAPTTPPPGVSAADIFGSFISHEPVTLTDAATDASGIKTVSYYYCTGSTGCANGGTLIGSSGVTTGNFPMTTNVWIAAPEAPYSIVAIATDNLDNVSSRSAATVITVDATPPTVSRPTVNGHSS
jgi:hypothetical protein